MAIRITIDVENLSGSTSDLAFADPLLPLLEVLDSYDVKATFFVVGSLANNWHIHLQRLAQQGHEIGLHGHTHQHLSSLGPAKFREELIKGKRTIEDVIGEVVIGYRAPYFSLTRSATWATDILAELGFKYSSSVLPALNPQSGFPGAPRKPFLWESGLVEFPVPTFGFGRISAPLLGGAYLRLIPHALFMLARQIASKRDYEWSYCHPYDFDKNAVFEKVRDSSWLFSRLIYAKRNVMLTRAEKLISLGQARSFSNIVCDKEFVQSLPKFRVTN